MRQGLRKTETIFSSKMMKKNCQWQVFFIYIRKDG